jgi:uncharacterized membrane protein
VYLSGSHRANPINNVKKTKHCYVEVVVKRFSSSKAWCVARVPLGGQTPGYKYTNGLFNWVMDYTETHTKMSEMNTLNVV